MNHSGMSRLVNTSILSTGLFFEAKATTFLIADERLQQRTVEVNWLLSDVLVCYLLRSLNKKSLKQWSIKLG